MWECCFSGYIIEYKSKDDTNFVKAAEIFGNTCKGKVDKGLEVGQQYQFRVRAVNKAGPGEPGEATLPHTCKARFRKFTLIFFTYYGTKLFIKLLVGLFILMSGLTKT